MNDVIYRQAAIDALNVGAELLRRVLDDADIVGAERAKYEWGLGLIESYISDMKELPSAQPEQRWIPCSERMPAYGEDVLISIGGYCNVGHIVSVNEEEQYNWYFSGWYHSPNDVDAWMPLPEPWEEGADE